MTVLGKVRFSNVTTQKFVGGANGYSDIIALQSPPTIRSDAAERGKWTATAKTKFEDRRQRIRMLVHRNGKMPPARHWGSDM